MSAPEDGAPASGPFPYGNPAEEWEHLEDTELYYYLVGEPDPSAPEGYWMIGIQGVDERWRVPRDTTTPEVFFCGFAAGVAVNRELLIECLEEMERSTESLGASYKMLKMFAAKREAGS